MSATRRLKDPRREMGIIRCAWCGTDEIEDWTLRDRNDSFYCSWGCYTANPQRYKNVKRNSLLAGSIVALVTTIIIAVLVQLGVFEVLLMIFILFSICPGYAYLMGIHGAVRAEEYRKSVPKGSRYREDVDHEKYFEIYDAITCPICGADIGLSGLEPAQKIHCGFCGANLERRESERKNSGQS
jgi:hypothetical protein